MRSTDPDRMSPAERLAELGEILAAGTQRLLARQGKQIRAVEVVEDHLDVLGQVEAPCDPNAMEATQ